MAKVKRERNVNAILEAYQIAWNAKDFGQAAIQGRKLSALGSEAESQARMAWVDAFKSAFGSEARANGLEFTSPGAYGDDDGAINIGADEYYGFAKNAEERDYVVSRMRKGNEVLRAVPSNKRRSAGDCASAAVRILVAARNRKIALLADAAVTDGSDDSQGTDSTN